MSNQIVRTTPSEDNPDGIVFIPESVAVDIGKSRGGGAGGATGATIAGPVADFVTNHGTTAIPEVATGDGYSYVQSDVAGNPTTFNDGTRDYVWNVEETSYLTGPPVGDYFIGLPSLLAGVEHIEIREVINDVDNAVYFFTKQEDGTWTLNPESNTTNAVDPAPIIPDNFSFFQTYNREHV
jgi:hypothetical protein